MDIGKFRDIANSGQMGRTRLDERDTNQAPFSETTLTAPNRSSAGKLFSRIGDFFLRAGSQNRQTQATQNSEVRNAFAQSLRQAFPHADAKLFGAVTQQSTKPLMVRDIKLILTNAEISNTIGAMRFTLPNSDRPVSIAPGLIPLSTLTQVDNLQEKLQEKINRGAEIVHKLRTDAVDKPVAPSKQDISDVMWFLHLAAENKAGAPFKAGAVTVDDPGGRIRQFLDRSDEVYQRKSSHIGAFQKVDGGAHRGIDFGGAPTNLNELLPNGRATVLYGRLAKGVHQMPREMLFLKMESHGCRLASPGSKIRDDVPHGPESRRVRLGHDLKAFFGHAFSFLGGIGERASGNHAADSRKERINKNFVEGFTTLVNAMPKGAQAMLLADDPLGKSGGIRVMLNNIERVRSELALFTGVDRPKSDMKEVDLEGDMFEIDLHDEPKVEQGTGDLDWQLDASHMTRAPVLFTGNRVPVEEPVDINEPVSTIFPEDQFVSQEVARQLDTLLKVAEQGLRRSPNHDPDTVHLRIGNEVILGKSDF